MSKASKEELGAALARIEQQLEALALRIERLEARGGPPQGKDPASAEATARAPAPARAEAPAKPQAPVPAGPAPESISEEEILAVSAALAAYLGVRVRIRQIRLLSSAAWAQQGRVSIQASHHLHS
ncbi:MAG TPA: hypothetical protein VMU15_07225 [Anaeromyxobacter sp.]|nr:hypothetical protein [Anaeromyxobacter sp.]